MRALNNAEVIAFTDATQWESWLAKHHERSSGLWLLIAKKGSDRKLITISDALDVALCYGWIDSQRKGCDANSYLQRYSPRTPKSPWSKLNAERAEALIGVKRMRAPGLTAIAAAQSDGRWKAAYISQRCAAIPPDLAAALQQNKRAGTKFGKLGKTDRYAIILPLLKATTPAMRLNRLLKVITRLEASSPGKQLITPR